jgi:2-dehydro-3-deoxyphosphogluconate aldolase/(4S)-4-hydroxy-2-oxoglutarate aldolase
MSTSTFPESLLDQIQRGGIVATLTIDDADDAVPLARALADGGVHCLELTLRTPTALESLRRIRAELPQVIVGAGTVLTPGQVKECLEADAAFGVAPGTNPRVVAEAQRLGLPFAPGVCTPSDIEHALEAGCTLMKFFPSEPCGGLAYLRTIAAPFAHLGVRFIPLGGVDGRNVESYLEEHIIPAIGGSWMAPRLLVQRKDWKAITERARLAIEAVVRARGGGA